MRKVSTLRRHITDLVIVFVGVALAFAVENLREDLNERAVGDQYLRGFRSDLLADLEMLQAQLATRRSQLEEALVVLEFFEGRPVNPQLFFEAYYSVLRARYTSPNRNTMDEVLSSGNLRLVRDANIRSRLLDLYVTYDTIAQTEDHISRDFDMYLYDTTFSSIRLQIEGPWDDTPANRGAVDALLNNLTIENGLRLIVANLGSGETGLLGELELAQAQVEHLLQIISVE